MTNSTKATVLLGCVLALSLLSASDAAYGVNSTDPQAHEWFDGDKASSRVLKLQGPVGRRFRARQAAGKGVINGVKKAYVVVGHELTVTFDTTVGKTKQVIAAGAAAVVSFGQCTKSSLNKYRPQNLESTLSTCVSPVENAPGCTANFGVATDSGKFQGGSANISCAIPAFSYAKQIDLYKSADVTITGNGNAALRFAAPFMAEVGFQFQQAPDAMFTLPSLSMDTEVSLALKASKTADPCAKDMTKCTLVLNQGLEELFATLIMAGPVPIAVRIKASAYVKAIPKLEGNVDLSASVTLKPVTLTNQLSLNINDPQQTFQSLQQVIKPALIAQQFKENLEVRLQGSAKAAASLKVCAGVKLTIVVNGMTSSVDVPVCVTAKVDASAVIDLVINPLNPSPSASGPSLRGSGKVAVAASVTRDAVEMNFALGLVDASSAIQGACGMSKLAMQSFTSRPVGARLQQCGLTDVLTCTTKLQSDICAAAQEVLPPALKTAVSFVAKTVTLVPAATLFEKGASASFSTPTAARAFMGFMGISNTSPERTRVAIGRDGVVTPAPGPMYTDRLEAGQELFQGQQLTSPNGIYRFIMQADGNAVLYKGATPLFASESNSQGVFWANGKNPKPVGPYRFAAQCDRNLVVYGLPEQLDQNGAAWESHTYKVAGSSCTPAKTAPYLPFLLMQNDGNLVYYDQTGDVIWASGTHQ